MKTFLLILMIINLAMGEDQMPDLSAIQQKISEDEIDLFLGLGGQSSISGEFFQPLLSGSELDTDQFCILEEKPKTRYELILIAQGNNQDATIDKMITPETRHRDFNKKVFEYGAANAHLSEKELVRSLSDMIINEYSSEDDRLHALAAFASKLNSNYNNSRNPGQNVKNKPIPKGDMTVNQLVKGEIESNILEGGVCNDIVEATAMIGESLFPEKDVLIINSGGHFGVVVSDGNKHTVIDYSKQTSMENQLYLDKKYIASNMRISKVVDGHLKEIAIVDTQTGELMEQAFQTGKPLLKTNPDIKSLVSHFKVFMGKHSVDVALGIGDMQLSKMYVVVAKYEYTTGKWKNHFGIGGTSAEATIGQSPHPTRYQIHFRAGSEYTHVRYATPQATLHVTTGLMLEGMFGIFSRYGPKVDMSGNLELANRVSGTYQVNPKIRLAGDLQFRQDFGPTSWGNLTGAASYGLWTGLSGALTNTSFHLNQVHATVASDQQIGKRVKAFEEIKYQGSHVGQAISILSGVSVNAPKDAQILVFVGYSNTELPGYLTKNSLLVGPNGGFAGAGIQTNSGITISGSVRDIAGDKRPTVQGHISVPLKVPKNEN